MKKQVLFIAAIFFGGALPAAPPTIISPSRSTPGKVEFIVPRPLVVSRPGSGVSVVHYQGESRPLVISGNPVAPKQVDFTRPLPKAVESTTPVPVTPKKFLPAERKNISGEPTAKPENNASTATDKSGAAH